MTHVDEQTGVVWVMPEPDGRCELCGAVEETRPYGPNGCQICFTCGERDLETTKAMFFARIDGRT